MCGGWIVRRTRLTVGLLGAGVALLLRACRIGELPSAPVPEQPANGATTTADTPLTFTVQAPAGQGVYLSVSKSPATDSNRQDRTRRGLRG